MGEPHVLTGDATAGFAVDWTGRFRGHTPAVVRPGDTAEVSAVLALCTGAGPAVVPQGETPAWSAAAWAQAGELGRSPAYGEVKGGDVEVDGGADQFSEDWGEVQLQ